MHHDAMEAICFHTSAEQIYLWNTMTRQHGMVMASMHHGSFIKTSDGITAHGMVNRNASQLVQNE